MVISATTLKIISSVIAAILSLVLAYLTFIVSYRWQMRHGNTNEIQTSVNNPFNLFILCGTIIITYYCVAKFLYDFTAFAVLWASFQEMGHNGSFIFLIDIHTINLHGYHSGYDMVDTGCHRRLQ